MYASMSTGSANNLLLNSPICKSVAPSVLQKNTWKCYYIVNQGQHLNRLVLKLEYSRTGSVLMMAEDLSPLEVKVILGHWGVAVDLNCISGIRFQRNWGCCYWLYVAFEVKAILGQLDIDIQGWF